MDRTETLKIMAVLKVAYPNFCKDSSTASQTVILWEEMFQADSYELVNGAIKAFIATDTKGFPPAIGIIKDYILKITTPPDRSLTEYKAWGVVKKAIANSAYGYVKEFEKLPNNLQRLVGWPNQLREWSVMDTDELDTVVASNFMRSYKVRQSSDREFQALPDNVKTLISNIQFKQIGVNND